MYTNNQDASTLEHFNQQAQEWWQPNGKMKTLHDINPARIDFINKSVNLKDLNVLDIGCGGGLLSEAMAKQGAKVLGIDLADELISVASMHASEQGITMEYRCISAEALAEEQPEKFDVISCMEMLEHVPNPEAILVAASKLLKPNGWLFASTLNKTLKAKVLGVWAAEYLLHLLPQGTHNPEQFITPHQLTAWARNNQLSARQMTGLHYNPFTRQTRLALPADINYLMAFQKS